MAPQASSSVFSLNTFCPSALGQIEVFNTMRFGFRVVLTHFLSVLEFSNSLDMQL